MEDFWQRPPRWLVFLFVGSLAVSSASMWTWWEGRRFQSRPLAEDEKKIVRLALDTWSELVPEQKGTRVLSSLLAEEKIRAMDLDSFARKEERITLGYTDERGRILLNPNICFSAYTVLGPRACDGVDGGDVVRTMTTLCHEFQHLSQNGPERLAYASEWSFLRRCLKQAEAAQDRVLVRELLEWEREMAERMRLYVGKGHFEKLKSRLSSGGSPLLQAGIDSAPAE